MTTLTRCDHCGDELPPQRYSEITRAYLKRVDGSGTMVDFCPKAECISELVRRVGGVVEESAVKPGPDVVGLSQLTIDFRRHD